MGETRVFRSWAKRLGVVCYGAVLVATFAAWTGAMAQTTRSSSRARGRAVMLRIRPHLGDTLLMKMEQHLEMSGDSSDGRPAMTATMRVYTRAVVEREVRGAIEMLSITDSVVVNPSSAAALPIFAQTKRALEGQAVHLRVAPDGAITVKDGSSNGARAAQELPAVLPDDPVAPGDVWTRSLAIPLSATSGSTGSVRATFKLDSLSPDDVVAYLSMHGSFSHKASGSAAGRDETTGAIAGTMQIDRRLEWLTDSQTTVTLVSTVRPPGSAEPTRVHLKVTQSMRAMPRH